MTQTGATQREELDEWLEDFIQRWEAAWNSHEPERLLELMTEDIVYDDSAWPRTMRGHGDVREFLEFTWRAFPDLRFEMSDGPYISPGTAKSGLPLEGARHAQRADRPARLRADREADRIRGGGLPRVSRRTRLPAPDRVRHDGREAPDRPDAKARLTDREGRRHRPAARGEGAGATEPLSQARTKRVHQRVNSRVPDSQRGQAKPGKLQALLNPPVLSGIPRSRPQITLVKRG